MKILRGAALALFLSSAFTASAQTVEIKGIRLGMTFAEYQALYPRALGNFTIAEVPEMRGGPDVTWRDGVLDSFVFLFDAKRYQDVRAALFGKYPAFRCETSPVATRGGVPLTQEVCTHGRAVLMRYGSDRDTSVISMASDALLAEQAAKDEAKRKDI